jgi:hypothetical protein
MDVSKAIQQRQTIFRHRLKSQLRHYKWLQDIQEAKRWRNVCEMREARLLASPGFQARPSPTVLVAMLRKLSGFWPTRLSERAVSDVEPRYEAMERLGWRYCGPGYFDNAVRAIEE